MSARQLIVLAIAAVAAIGALFLIRSMNNRPAAPAQTAAPIAGEQVLVAARDIPQGAALAPSDIAVRIFPTESVTPNFVRISVMPSAQTDYVGAVTRRAFAAGEPITMTTVVQPEGRGFMAAQLEPGYRAVAIEISATSAAGHYIQPNDRVDVMLTRRTDDDQARSDVVLSDVRVLAMGGATQPQTSGEAPAQVSASYAVLELAQADARTLMQAERMGQISLALRGLEVETVGLRGQSNPISGNSVRVHAFGNVSGGN
ncbi:MAG: Flp pilus assembly protein CpaB [Terricaulis sp.]|nr:Flp pilus assembly protein CpaB [Terricaulis sp.]